MPAELGAGGLGEEETRTGTKTHCTCSSGEQAGEIGEVDMVVKSIVFALVSGRYCLSARVVGCISMASSTEGGFGQA